MSKKCNCSDCGEKGDFNAQVAYENLTRKYTELADVVVKYVSEAGLDRAERVLSAMEMAAILERIIGGRETTDFPECCLIGRESLGGSRRWFCTGVLVHPRIVLTAGHCTDQINLVALNCFNQNQLQGAEIVRVKPFIHKQFNRINDIAVLVLQTAANTAPVRIATTQEMSEATSTTLVGFGNNNILSTVGFGIKREVEVPINFIRRTLTDDLNNAEFQFGFESDVEFVAGGQGFDSCNGDSGGPAYIGVNGVRKVAGLTSRGFDFSTNPCGDGGIYTRVDVHFEFIRQIAQQNGIIF